MSPGRGTEEDDGREITFARVIHGAHRWRDWWEKAGPVEREWSGGKELEVARDPGWPHLVLKEAHIGTASKLSPKTSPKKSPNSAMRF